MSVNLSTIRRQLIDIVNEGQKFKEFDNFTEEKVEQFSKYSLELKSFLMTYSDNTMIIERLGKIEEVRYEEDKLQLWMIILLTVFIVPHLLLWVRDYLQKKECQSKILEITALFSSIEFLLRNYEE